MKREVAVEQAVGLRLAHDMTQIIPGQFKGVAFPKGHVIAEGDVARLLDMGKRHVYVLDIGPDEVHEDDAAARMAQVMAGSGIEWGQPHEGKVVLKAAHDGMLWVDGEAVIDLNLIPDVSIATRQPFGAVKAAQSVAAVRPIPLIFARQLLEQVEQVASTARRTTGRGTVEVWPFRPQRVFIVTTGSEVQAQRVEDKFGPVLHAKFAQFGISIAHQTIVGDELADIRAAIGQAVAAGATLVCVTGGMSVDPDDRSPAAIRAVADEVVTYGTPMLPGSMTMVAYAGATAIFGLPGAVIHDPLTAFDILLPRALAGWRLRKADIARHGVGGWLNA